MSRLADMLTGMDRGASRPEGVGGIPRLTVSAPAPRPTWRLGAVLVMVVIMAGAGVGIMLRPRNVPLTSIPVPAPLANPRLAPPADTEGQFTALLARGRQAAQRGALEESGVLLRQALELNPRDGEAWNSLGVVLVQQGEPALGVDALNQALSVNPNHVEAHLNLAVVLDRQGAVGEARAHYRAFLRLASEDHPARAEVRRRVAEFTPSKPRE